MLIVRGMTPGAAFTFPTELRMETERQEFRQQLPELFDLIFLPSKTGPWLEKEFFDPSSPESEYFLSPPQRFLELTAKILADHGHRELGKALNPNKAA